MGIRENVVLAVASSGHEVWRKPRLKPDGTFEPRIKTTTDAAWIAANGGKNEVDIANLSYSELPADWQAENRAAGEDVADLVLGAIRLGVPLDELFVESSAPYVHDRWCVRNQKHVAPELLLTYSLIIEEEKEKDREKVRIGITAATTHTAS